MRQATAAEIKWCDKMRRLIKSMPPTMSLFADGKLFAVDAEENRNYDYIEHFQSLSGVTSMGRCDGGDPWK